MKGLGTFPAGFDPNDALCVQQFCAAMNDPGTIYWWNSEGETFTGGNPNYSWPGVNCEGGSAGGANWWRGWLFPTAGGNTINVSAAGTGCGGGAPEGGQPSSCTFTVGTAGGEEAVMEISTGDAYADCYVASKWTGPSGDQQDPYNFETQNAARVGCCAVLVAINFASGNNPSSVPPGTITATVTVS